MFTKLNQSKKTKSRKGIFKPLIESLVILGVSVLPYMHDFEGFRGVDGFSGFSSLRIGLFITLMFIVALSGWIVAFVNSRGKKYRFAILAPIFMLTFQLCIYLFDSRQHEINDFNWKVLVNLAIAITLVLINFLGGNEKSTR